MKIIDKLMDKLYWNVVAKIPLEFMLGAGYVALAGMAIMVATIVYTAHVSPLGMGDPLIGRLLGAPR